MTLRYAVIFEQAQNNWAAYVPDLPGGVTTGSKFEETERNIREAIEGHLRTLQEFGDPVPHPTSVAKEIEIQPAAWRIRSGNEAPIEASLLDRPSTYFSGGVMSLTGTPSGPTESQIAAVPRAYKYPGQATTA